MLTLMGRSANTIQQAITDLVDDYLRQGGLADASQDDAGEARAYYSEFRRLLKQAPIDIAFSTALAKKILSFPSTATGNNILHRLLERGAQVTFFDAYPICEAANYSADMKRADPESAARYDAHHRIHRIPSRKDRVLNDAENTMRLLLVTGNDPLEERDGENPVSCLHAMASVRVRAGDFTTADRYRRLAYYLKDISTGRAPAPSIEGMAFDLQQRNKILAEHGMPVSEAYDQPSVYPVPVSGREFHGLQPATGPEDRYPAPATTDIKVTSRLGVLNAAGQLVGRELK